jgi:hypothetical protein
MARPFEFPDVDDRTKNEPVFLVSPTQVLGNYNQANTVQPQVLMNDDVRIWFRNEACRLGWATAEFRGNQCLLIASFW